MLTSVDGRWIGAAVNGLYHHLVVRVEEQGDGVTGYPLTHFLFGHDHTVFLVRGTQAR